MIHPIKLPSRPIISACGVTVISFRGRLLSGQTRIEKIVQKYVNACDKSRPVYQGDYVKIKPKYIMTHDNTSSVINKFREIKSGRVCNRKQIVFMLDHDIQNQTKENLEKYRKIENFAKEQGIDFYPAGRGIGHQVLVEEGYIHPDTLVVASDSHSNMYGGLGCLGTPVVRTDAAAIWATGETWWQVPRVVKVEFKNKLPKSVSGKDLIITLCGEFNKDEVLNCCIEFYGKEGLGDLTIDERLTIANMTTEWGALAGIFPIDEVTLDWYNDRIGRGKYQSPERLKETIYNLVKADDDAQYCKHLTIDLSTVTQAVSGPNSLKIKTPISILEKKKIKINKAYLVSCVNSRTSDIKIAANVLRNRKISDGVEFYVSPASSMVRDEVQKSGHWDIIVNSGAKILPAGCGPCIGLGTGLLNDGDVGISATNRNYKGRMGSPLASTYLASPEVVAASVVSGYISSPASLNGHNIPLENDEKVVVKSVVNLNTKCRNMNTSNQSLVPGFRSEINGNLIFLDSDNLNTDGIYPGKYTYRDNITREEMAKIVMENYDESFARSISNGDIIISGYNFGTGSSREQAAVAILYAGIPLVIAGSFSDIYKRNAINNGLMVIEVPELVEYIREKIKNNAFSSQNKLTIKTGWKVNVSLAKGTISVKNSEGVSHPTFSFLPIGEIAQELAVAGGLSMWAKSKISEQEPYL